MSHESVPSQIDNLVTSLYGAITKDASSGKIVWNIPCDPNQTAQITGLPRISGEGLLCYMIRGLSYVIQNLGITAAVTLNGVQTLTNKTLVAPTITGNGAISGIFTGNLTGTASSATNVAGGSAGSILYQSAAGLTAFTSVGTAGQVLLSNGSGAPTWGTNASGTADNLAGGGAGRIPYQSAAGVTAFTAAGTLGQFLTSGGTGAPSWTTATSSTASNLAGGNIGSLPFQIGPSLTSFLSPGISGYVLTSNGTGVFPTWGPVTATTTTATQVLGNTTGTPAAAGYVGEYFTGTGTTQTLSDGGIATVSTLTLQPGQYRILGYVTIQHTGATGTVNFTKADALISSGATFPSGSNATTISTNVNVAGPNTTAFRLQVEQAYINLASPIAFSLNVFASFTTVSGSPSIAATGGLQAIRVR